MQRVEDTEERFRESINKGRGDGDELLNMAESFLENARDALDMRKKRFDAEVTESVEAMRTFSIQGSQQ